MNIQPIVSTRQNKQYKQTFGDLMMPLDRAGGALVSRFKAVCPGYPMLIKQDADGVFVAVLKSYRGSGLEKLFNYMYFNDKATSMFSTQVKRFKAVPQACQETICKMLKKN